MVHFYKTTVEGNLNQIYIHAIITINLPGVCPQGHYCLQGTEEKFQHPCPSGTFSTATGLTAELQCTNCTAGFYCDRGGKNTTSGECKAGYYCPERSEIATAVPCPMGNYCPVQV